MEKTTSFTIGKVTGVHGLDGNLKVWSFAESIDTFCPGRKIVLKTDNGNQEEHHSIHKVLNYKKGLLLSLEGVDNQELAQKLIGKEIIIDRTQLAEPDEGTWYFKDLLGLEVFDNKRDFIGKVTEIFPTGADDVLVVNKDTQETLVPMHKFFIESIDVENNIIKTTLPDDL